MGTDKGTAPGGRTKGLRQGDGQGDHAMGTDKRTTPWGRTEGLRHGHLKGSDRRWLAVLIVPVLRSGLPLTGHVLLLSACLTFQNDYIIAYWPTCAVLVSADFAHPPIFRLIFTISPTTSVSNYIPFVSQLHCLYPSYRSEMILCDCQDVKIQELICIPAIPCLPGYTSSIKNYTLSILAIFFSVPTMSCLP